MAHIIEQAIVIRLSKLARTGDAGSLDIPADVLATLEAFMSELIGDPAVVVEIATDETA